jgi:hypothetical protein
VDVIDVLSGGGILRAAEVVALAGAAKLDLAAAATLLMKETGGGRNVWGNDNVDTGGNYVKGAEVTQAAYLRYRAARTAHNAQGVGPTQLTSASLQDLADQRGGAWDWRVNCAVGFEILADGISRLGLRGGFKAYNGADAYAADAMARYAVWNAALSTAKPQPKGENMLENYRVTGNGTLRLICPVGSASAITEKAWLSAASDGPDAATVRWFAQSDTKGISDGTWTIGVHNGRSDRPSVELPDGTTQISVLYQFDQDGVIALETQSK